MTGSLQIKNNKYYMVFNYNENGKRKQKWEATHLPVRGNKKKAEKMLAERKAEYEKRVLSPESSSRFDLCVISWMNHIKSQVSEVTYQGYESIANTHIIPYFKEKGTAICDINRKILQEYFDKKAFKGRADGKGKLSSRSLILHKNIINQTLNEAIKNGLISQNPCTFISLPKGEKREPTFYSLNELNALLSAVKEEVLYPAIKIASFYGLRRSELIGLKWDSIDFENNRFTIENTIVKVRKTVEKNKTKNSTSHRSLPLPQDMKEMLLNMKATEEKNAALMGQDYIRNNYVFKHPNGSPISPDYVSHGFKKLLSKYNLKPIRFHDLRHSCASILLSKGFLLKDVQEWLGHADIKMTANIYGHLDLGRKNELANAMSDMFSA